MRGHALFLALVLMLRTGQGAFAEDWPQAAADPERTSHVRDQPVGPYRVAWVKGWGEEIIRNTNQPIIVAGAVYVGSTNGVVHAVDAETGADLWSADVGSLICHALAGDGQKVYVATFDGRLHALDSRTGRPVWETPLSRRGFSAAPLLMDGALFIGNRDGLFYAVRARDGKRMWETDTGAPITQTAAGHDGKVVFVNDAIVALCLDAKSGREMWRRRLIGHSVRDYWPVIHDGRVLIRTQQAGPRELAGHNTALQSLFYMPVSYNRLPPPDQIRFIARTPDDIIREQDILVGFFRQHPIARTGFVLDLTDGSEPVITSLTPGCRMTGAPPPPCLAGDGDLYTTFRSSAGERGYLDIARSGFGRFSIRTGKIDKPIAGSTGIRAVVGRGAPFELTSDETVTLSSGGDLVFGFRADHNGGAMSIRTTESWRFPSVALPRSSDMLPSGNILAISGRHILHVKFNHLICIEGRLRRP